MKLSEILKDSCECIVCAREIDREALAKELFITFGTDVKEWEHSVQRKLYFDFAEIIILSMPTWLRKVS